MFDHHDGVIFDTSAEIRAITDTSEDRPLAPGVDRQIEQGRQTVVLPSGELEAVRRRAINTLGKRGVAGAVARIRADKSAAIHILEAL